MRNAIASIIIALAVALLPVYSRYTTVDMNRTAKDNLFLILCGLIAIVFRDVKRDFPQKGWIALVIAFFLSVFNQHNVASINVMMYSFYFMGGAILLVRVYECIEQSHIELILNAMCVGALIQFVVISLALLGFSIESHVASFFHNEIKINGDIFSHFGASQGTLGNPNLSGGYLALCSLAFFRKKWIYLLPLSLFALLATGSAMAVASFLAGAGFLFKGNIISKRNIYLLSIFSMLTSLFTGLGKMDSGRHEIWRMAVAKVDKSDYLFGNGLGWFQDIGLAWSQTIVRQEHSGFLTLFNAFGLVGVVGLLYFLWIYTNKKDVNKLFSAITFAAFCNAYGHFSIQQSTMMIIIIVSVAICAIKDEDNELGRGIASK